MVTAGSMGWCDVTMIHWYDAAGPVLVQMWTLGSLCWSWLGVSLAKLSANSILSSSVACRELSVPCSFLGFALKPLCSCSSHPSLREPLCGWCAGGMCWAAAVLAEVGIGTQQVGGGVGAVKLRGEGGVGREGMDREELLRASLPLLALLSLVLEFDP